MLTGVADTSEELSLVLLKNLLLLSTIPMSAVCLDFAFFAGIVDTGDEVITGINDTGDNSSLASTTLVTIHHRCQQYW